MTSPRTYTVIDQRPDWGATLRLSEPMRLSGGGGVAEDGALTSPCEEFSVVVVVALPEEKFGVFDRTLIHAGVPVDEPTSKTFWAVTGQFSRRVDGIADVAQAMALQGYVPAEVQ